MTITELCQEWWEAEHQVLEENKTVKETVVHDKTNLADVAIQNASSFLLPEALASIKGVTTNQHVKEGSLEETTHRVDDESHNLQSPAGFIHLIANPHLQLQERECCCLQNKL